MDAVPFSFVECVLLSLHSKNETDQLDNASWSSIGKRLSSRQSYVAIMFKNDSGICCNFRDFSTRELVSFDEIKAAKDSSLAGVWIRNEHTLNHTITMDFNSFETNLLPFLLSRLVPTAYLSILQPGPIAEMLMARLLERRGQNCLRSVHFIYCGQLSVDFLQNQSHENRFLNSVSLSGDHWPSEILINVRRLLLRKQISLQISSPPIDFEFARGIVDYWKLHRGIKRSFFFTPNFDFRQFGRFMKRDPDSSYRYNLVLPMANAVLNVYRYVSTADRFLIYTSYE